MDDSKITVAVCGDSFCAACTTDLQGTGTGLRAHFSQMLEDVYAYKVMHLAHGGFSNLAILFQIRQAIKQGAQVIVYNHTWSSRVELLRDQQVNCDIGTNNFFYYDPNCESSHMPWAGKDNAPILSTTWQGIDKSPLFQLSKEQVQAVHTYLKHMYNDNLHTEVDSWLFEYWHGKIIAAGALPIRFRDEHIGKIAYDFSFQNQTFDTPFHTDRATQEQIAANIHRYIVDNISQ